MTSHSPTPHRLPFANGWDLWKWVMVRAAGFPASWVTGIAAPNAAAAADRLLTAQEQRQKVFADAPEKLQQLMTNVSPLRRKIARKLRKGKAPTELLEVEGGAALLEGLQEVLATIAEAESEVEECYQQDDADVVAFLAKLADDSSFQEALSWQNPKAAALMLPRLRETRIRPTSGHRQTQRAAANYLQRYCVKNDTIGFFGPIGWADVTAEEGGAHYHVGTNALAARKVFFEDWAIESIARKYSENAELLKSACPRRHPAVRQIGEELEFAGRGRSAAPEFVLQLLQNCDGRPASVIARSLVASDDEFADEDEVYESMEQLVEEGILIWQFEIPSLSGNALALLRRQVSESGSEPGRAACEELDVLEELRQNVQSAAGRPDEVLRAHERLAEAFEAVSGTAASRHKGQMYAGRSVLYEDCLRAQAMTLGPEFVDGLRQPLDGILQAARWLLYQGGERYKNAIEATFNELTQASGESRVEFVSLLAAVHPTLNATGPGSVVGELERELQEKWSKVLSLSPGHQRVQVSGIELAERSQREFSSPCPETPSGLFQSPDIMASGESLEAILAGKGTYVLGELHVGVNTLAAPFLLRWHPDEEAISKAYHDDVGSGAMEPVRDRSATTRPDIALPIGEHYEIELGQSLSRLPPANRLALADLEVRRVDGELVVLRLGTEEQFPILSAFENYVAAALANSFVLFASAGHQPRITIDRVVMAREMWIYEGEGIPRLPAAKGAKQFLAARKWARAQNFPRLVFYKSREETKPVYLDFDSPISIENFCTIAAGASKITISEMLPTPDQAWLPDGSGRLFTCEFRMILADQTSSKAPTA